MFSSKLSLYFFSAHLWVFCILYTYQTIFRSFWSFWRYLRLRLFRFASYLFHIITYHLNILVFVTYVIRVLVSILKHSKPWRAVGLVDYEIYINLVYQLLFSYQFIIVSPTKLAVFFYYKHFVEISICNVLL